MSLYRDLSESLRLTEARAVPPPGKPTELWERIVEAQDACAETLALMKEVGVDERGLEAMDEALSNLSRAFTWTQKRVFQKD